MSIMKYKAICFDIDGTLYPKSLMNKRLLRLGLTHPLFSMKYNKMRKELRKCQDSLSGSLMSKEATVICKNMGKEANEDLVKEHLKSWIYEPMRRLYLSTKPYAGVLETFKAIKERGLEIGVFSDFPLFNKLESMGLASYVDYASSSEVVGFLKPSVHCFENLLYNIGLDSSQVLYVGDSYDKDIVGARACGMDAVLVNVKGKGKKYPLACEVFESWKGFDSWLMERLE